MFDLTYGKGKVSFDVPEERLAKEQPFIRPRKVDITPEILDIEGSIVRALENPIGSERLKDIVRGKRVALVVSDEFRAGQQELILKCMLSEISAGAPGEVWIFCATGSHDPNIYAVNIRAWAEKYSKLFGLNFRFIANDCTKDAFIHIGTCSDNTPIEINGEILKCDIRAYGHESKHHYMNGYSCIDKQLLPGLASAKTIESNHKNALNDRLSFGGRNVYASEKERRINPFSEGCFEARVVADATFVNEYGKAEKRELRAFGLDMISDLKHVYWAAAGNIETVSRAMTKEADKMSAFEVAPTKYVIISPGGPPASQTLYSTQNCFDMALSGAITDGGEALITAPCDGRPDVPEDVRGLAPDGKSKALFYENLVRMKDWPIEKSSKWIFDHFELYLWKTDRVLKLMNRRKIKLYLHSQLPEEKVKAAGLIPVKDVQAWIDERAARGDSAIRIIDDGNKMLIMKKPTHPTA